jgi:hypothetical protein
MKLKEVPIRDYQDSRRSFDNGKRVGGIASR